MKRHDKRGSILLLGVLAAMGASRVAIGAEVYAGTGMGFSNRVGQWVANVIFQKADKKGLKDGVTAAFHTGQDLTPACVPGISANNCAIDQTGLIKLIVPATVSTAWCDASVAPPQPSATRYSVTANFDEPAYNDIAVPRDTVFQGSFDWDFASKTLTAMRGTMNQVMVSADQKLTLTQLMAWSYDEASDTVTASVFRNASTAIYKPGSYDQVPKMPLADGTSNAYFTLNFKASDPTAVAKGNIDKMVYGDCVGDSLMGNICMSGLLDGGSMSGYPQGLTITSSGTAAAAAAAATAECYGSAFDSKWAVVDLNGLRQAGVGSVWVKVTATRYDDGVAEETDGQGHSLPGDDDLVPAVTVFRGRQDVGVHGYWYPNQFQPNPKFWAWKLSPFYSGTATNDTTVGWATANGSASNHSASVSGKYLLKPGNQNYLTVAVGGDGRDGPAAHDVNFELAVRVSRKPPPAN